MGYKIHAHTSATTYVPAITNLEQTLAGRVTSLDLTEPASLDPDWAAAAAAATPVDVNVVSCSSSDGGLLGSELCGEAMACCRVNTGGD